MVESQTKDKKIDSIQYNVISKLKEHSDYSIIIDDDGSVFMAMKSLVYFDDAEKEPMPDMLINKSWEQVKEYILSKIS